MSPHATRSAADRGGRAYRLLALAPVVAIVGAPWFANRIEPRIFGLPFLLAWIAGWVVATSAIMAYIWSRDRAT